VFGVEEMRKKVKSYNPKYVEEVTGVSVGKLKKAAKIIGKTSSMLSTALQVVYQSHQATVRACQVSNINLLRGLIGNPSLLSHRVDHFSAKMHLHVDRIGI